MATNITSAIICIAIFLAAEVWFAGGFDFPWWFGILNYAAAQAIWLAVDIYSDWINDRIKGRGQKT